MDDFSFPTIPTEQDTVCQLPFPHFTASPLWFLSSVAPDAEDDADCQLRRSVSAAEDAANIVDALNTVAAGLSDDEGSRSIRRLFESEHKMDMLWEDFNEELLKKGGEQKVLGLSRVHPRRASLVVMLKMLKRLFFLRKIIAPRGHQS